NRYGALGLTIPQRFLASEGLHDQEHSIEPLREWLSCLHWTRDMVKLWDLAREGDRKGLAALVRCDGEQISAFYTKYDARSTGWITKWWRDTSPEIFNLLSAPSDVVTAAWLVLQDEVGEVLDVLVRARFAWDREAVRPVLRLAPHGLFGAICLQFAQAIDGDRNYQACPVCGRWFELAPGVNRADKLMCSDACRMRAYRQRQERARQMHAEGKNARQIAAELESDVATVKGWIGKHKGKGK